MRICKFYHSSFQEGCDSIVDVEFCCKTLKSYWSIDIIFWNAEDMVIMDKNGIIFKYCPFCGAKIQIKESRL